MSQSVQTTAPDRIDWPRLLRLARLVGVRVWRADPSGNLVEVAGPDNARPRSS